MIFMSTPLNLGRDVAGNTSYAPISATDKWSATLVTGGASAITVPDNFQNWIAVFSYQPGCNVWVDFSGGTAAVPAGATLASNTSELNPGARLVKAGDSISVVTNNATCDMGIMLYAIS
jgi:hypothetical protein